MAAPKDAKRTKIRTVDLGRGRTARIRVVTTRSGRRTVYGQINRKAA